MQVHSKVLSAHVYAAPTLHWLKYRWDWQHLGEPLLLQG